VLRAILRPTSASRGGISECLIAYCTSAGCLRSRVPSGSLPCKSVRSRSRCREWRRLPWVNAILQATARFRADGSEMFRAARRLWILNEAFFHFPSNLRRYIRHSAYNFSNGPQQFVALGGHKQISGGANPERFAGNVGIRIHSKQYQLYPRHCLLQLSRCIQTVQQRHTNIDQQQIWPRFFRCCYQRSVGANRTNHFEFRAPAVFGNRLRSSCDRRRAECELFSRRSS